MNESECESLIKSVKWTDPTNLISLAILEFINVLVIGGNCLVIAAVFCSNKLRSVTNFFIVNLAVADLLVGLAVLPFSATWEVFKVWIFGDVWCRIWLAVDVWMCTASILNLCAISLDRYVAVTRPVTYPSIMSTKKAKSLIAGIWVLSFVICFPPLVTWKDQKIIPQPTYIRGNYTLYYATSTTTATATSTSSVHNLLGKQHHKQQQQEKEQQQHYTRQAHQQQIAATIHTIHNNPYNPYDPSFAPLDTEDAVLAATHSPIQQQQLQNHQQQKPMTVKTFKYDELTYSPPPPPPPPPSAVALDDFDYETATTKTTTTTTSSASTVININGPPTSCPWKCELTNDRGYVVYSALGSFYIPMFVMLFFYWRIYRAAVRTTRAINQGFKTTKGSKGIGSRFEEQRLTLRIHRGRGGSNQHESMHSNGSTQSTTTTLGTPSPERLSKYSTRRLHHQHDKIKISVSYPSTENIHEMIHDSCATCDSSHQQQQHSQQHRNSQPSGNAMYAVHHYNSANGQTTETQLFRQHLRHGGSNCFLQVMGRGLSADSSRRRQSSGSDIVGEHHRQQPNKKMGKRNIKAQVKRFRMETKAAKTLAIIVGLFILCWLPFFTIYIIRPFCQDCIDPLLFSILFWLGYCNSAVNPMIYALFSKDFRFAFKRIICRCFCYRQSVSLKTSRRGSDMSAIRIPARTPSITPSAAAHSFDGDDSELHHSEMSTGPNDHR